MNYIITILIINAVNIISMVTFCCLDILDKAVLRPGRLDKTLYIGLPTAEERAIILKTITKVCESYNCT